jgi:hypothetical protein
VPGLVVIAWPIDGKSRSPWPARECLSVLARQAGSRPTQIRPHALPTPHSSPLPVPPPPPGIGGIDDWRICTGSPAGSASRDLGYIVRYMYGAGKAPELKGAALGVFPAEASSMGYIEPFPTDPARIRSLYWQYREMKEKHKMFSAKFSAKVFHAGWSDAARLVLGHGITLPTTAEEAAAAAAGEDTTDGGGEDDDHGGAAAAAVAAASTDSARQPRPSGAGAGSGDAGGTATPRSLLLLLLPPRPSR